MAPRGLPEARAVDLETIENVIVMVLDGPSSALELCVEQSDNDELALSPRMTLKRRHPVRHRR